MNKRLTILFILILLSSYIFGQIDSITRLSPALEDFSSRRILALDNNLQTHLSHKQKPKNWGLGFEIFSGYNFYTGDLNENYTNYFPVGLALDVDYKNFKIFLRRSFGANKTKQDFDYYFGLWERHSRVHTFKSETALGYTVYHKKPLKLTPFLGITRIKINPPTAHTGKEVDPKKGLLKSTKYTIGINLDIKCRITTNGQYSFVRIRSGYGMQRPNNNNDVITGNIPFITIGYGSTNFW